MKNEYKYQDCRTLLLKMLSLISTYNHWSLMQGRGGAWGIVLHMEDRVTRDRLVGLVAEYLNEYDNDGWLPATSLMVDLILHDAWKRENLGIVGEKCQREQVEEALMRRGCVVLGCGVRGQQGECLRAFHVGVVQGGVVDCSGKQLIINGDLIDDEAMVSMIADVFIGWQHQQMIHRFAVRAVP